MTSNKVKETTIDDRVRQVLSLVNLTAKSQIPENAPERQRNLPEDKALLRRAAAESIVLLKNEGDILPLSPSKKTLVIGPNANIATYCGGGSACLPAYYTVTPLQGIKNRCAGGVSFSQGAYGHKELPLLGEHLITEDGKPGYTFRVYKEPSSVKGRVAVDTLHMISTSAFLMDYTHPEISGDLYYITMDGIFVPPTTGVYDLGLTVAGTGLLYVDGELIVDNKTDQRQGTSFFGIGTPEERGSVYMNAGQRYHIYVDFGTAPTSDLKLHGVVSFGPGGLRLGGCPRIDPEQAIKDAVELASQADQVVVCVGLSGEWESEGFDRPDMHLPPMSDELVQRVLEVRPNAVIVVQSGTPVTMPWAHDAKALLHAWYGGNEGGNGIADVLFGDVNPVSLQACRVSSLATKLLTIGRAPCPVCQAPSIVSSNSRTKPVIPKLPLRGRPCAVRRGCLRRLPLLRESQSDASVLIWPWLVLHSVPFIGPDHQTEDQPHGQD